MVGNPEDGIGTRLSRINAGAFEWDFVLLVVVGGRTGSDAADENGDGVLWEMGPSMSGGFFKHMSEM